MSQIEYRVVGLAPEPFAPLFDLDDEELARRGIRRRFVDEAHSAPCRVSLEDAEPGEEVLLLPYAHLDENSPYRAQGAIYVRRMATSRFVGSNAIPDQLRRRLLSVRAYDAAHLMVESEVVEGADLEGLIQRFFANRAVDYLHVHNARPGCYSCRIERVASA
ncbi:MAG TPA: DUF1203 domain-containing protein [Candidatus Eisenbacteria bacterium]